MRTPRHIDTIFKFLPHTRQHGCLKARITAVKNIDASMLTRVWQQLEHSIYVSCVTRGTNIEYL
jgi:hypothetical protein